MQQTHIHPAPIEITEAGYRLALAATPADVEACQRLRFNVFNLELGEGLDASYLLGRDADEFDRSCDHLMVTARDSGACVGTYRLRTRAQGAFYAEGEFDLAALPAALLDDAVELGRACISRAHRMPQVLFLLWRGIARYMLAHDKRYLFGCCSLTSQDPAEGWAVHAQLAREGALHPQWRVAVRPDHVCAPGAAAAGARVPKLFRAYLRLGAQCLSAPAIDRAFGTIDYFVLFDRAHMPPEAQGFFA